MLFRCGYNKSREDVDGLNVLLYGKGEMDWRRQFEPAMESRFGERVDVQLTAVAISLPGRADARRAQVQHPRGTATC